MNDTIRTVHFTAFPGRTLLGQIDFHDRPIEADVTGVWRDDATGQLYYADDCNFEGMTPDPVTRDDLTPCTADEFEVYLTKRLDTAEWMNDRTPYRAEITQLMARIRNL